MAGADYGEIIYRNGVFQPHASELGSGRVRVSFHKNYPVVTIDGVEQDVKQWIVYPERDEDGYIWTDTNESEYSATIIGHRFQARHVGGNMLDVELIEPDGTIWHARGGYEIGAAFLEDGETPETFYQRLMSHRFHWTR